MYRQTDLILGLVVAVTAGLALVFGVRERRNLPAGGAAWNPWSIVLGAALFGSGALMIFGAVTDRDFLLGRSVLLALMMIATAMMLIKQRTAK